MNRVVVAAVALVLLLSLCAADATLTPSKEAHEQPVTPAAYAERLVRQAFSDISHDEVAAAQTKLDQALQAEGFAQLPTQLRYQALWVASLIAEQKGQDQKTHDLSLRVTKFDQADSSTWATRLYSAYTTGDYRDAAHSMAVIAKRWPAKLDDIDPVAMWSLNHQLQTTHDLDAEREMLDALFHANWQDRGVEPSNLWRDLALLYIERNDIERATIIALRITSSQTALSMRVDKRFDPITLKHPEAFNVERLMASELAAAQAQVKAHPDQLAPITHLQQLLLVTRQYRQVLAISDAAIKQAKRGDGKKAYTDFNRHYNWILDNRSRALKRQGRWDEAVQVEMRATRRPELGAMNVSQLINLGDLYASLLQPDKASHVVMEIGEMSPFGRMQLENVKLKIAVGKKDHAATVAAMAYLREHRADAIATWQRALLLRGELDAAAALLIERLHNPTWRNGALVAMQHYADVTETPLEKLIEDHWTTVTARADVQTAMQKVGRVEQFQIAAALR